MPEGNEIINEIAQRILDAKAQNALVMLAFGAHLVKNGVGSVLIKMMENGWLTQLATQGAGGIHDWGFSYLGGRKKMFGQMLQPIHSARRKRQGNTSIWPYRWEQSKAWDTENP